mmetsp:Transcript_40719/g.79687  ORF Transcript_40719/g.79687 Transcript_40719/m.79687 type:complete len:167 (-) Transcript_40719:621-1121(-)
MSNAAPRKEIYTYQAPWTIFAMSWSQRLDSNTQFRLAAGSYVEQYSNSVQIIKRTYGTSSHEGRFYKACEFEHPYPCTKILWSPDQSQGGRDILATSGDYLRIWNLSDDGSQRGTLIPKKEALLNNVSNPVFLHIFHFYTSKTCNIELLGASCVKSKIKIASIAHR